MPSKDLYPIHHLDDHEFFPGDFVTEAKDGFHPHSYGVVQEVGLCQNVSLTTYKMRLLLIMWQ